MNCEIKQHFFSKMLRRAICIPLAVSILAMPTAHAQDSAEAWIDVIIGISLPVALTAAGGREISAAGGEIISIGLSLPNIALCALVATIRLREDGLRDNDSVNEIFSAGPRADQLDFA